MCHEGGCAKVVRREARQVGIPKLARVGRDQDAGHRDCRELPFKALRTATQEDEPLWLQCLHDLGGHRHLVVYLPDELDVCDLSVLTNA